MGTSVPAAVAMLVAALSAVSVHGAGKCAGDSARYRIMPPVIGRPGATARSPYDLPCDSMVVPLGQTTTIHGLSVVNFGPGSRAGGKIVVKGKLVIEGKPGNPAYLAGSIAPNTIGFAPGNRPWYGITADSGAVLRISHARFYNASAGMTLSSRDVILKNCFFKGTSALTLPDTTLPLNPVGQSLSSLDLREGWLSIFSGGSAAKSMDEPEEDPSDQPAAVPVPEEVSVPKAVPTPVSKAPSEARSNPEARKGYPEQGARAGKGWTWLAGGAGILAVSAIVWWVLPAEETPQAPPVTSGQLDAAPDLPEPGPAGP
ncbi:MAG TPA: hypothetical protein VK465_14550 [Fibrobacteria bacterium]|nr:hypothetical protein [Fibrobacteria bacterium]